MLQPRVLVPFMLTGTIWGSTWFVIAGQIAEKLEKQRLIVITTTMEIVIMSLAAVGFLLQNLPVLLVALFCTGVQSTLFGPVKYSVLPAILKPEELTGGNGLVEMGTSISILCGMIAGGMIFQVAGAHGPQAAAIAIVLLAVLGNVLSRMIPRMDAGAPDLKVHWNPIPESLAVRLNGLAPTWLDAGFKRNSRALPAAATTDHPPVITPLSSPI